VIKFFINLVNHVDEVKKRKLFQATYKQCNERECDNEPSPESMLCIVQHPKQEETAIEGYKCQASIGVASHYLTSCIRFGFYVLVVLQPLELRYQPSHSASK
jgi:hypothetical protein